ncbi:helix-turn-helix domain-containing protein [Rummeliibacillus sp. NPDC094406]|uniref:helix-turn-helix domain-containing protein n=1 Tax=Rummeliibacillus sp. NPDC094406 TaxID=3364511 RepID=UPI0037FE3882
MAENINGVIYEGLLSKGYGLIPQMITRDKDLSIEAKAIYGYLSAFAGNNNEAFPSVELICAELGISENRYRKHRKALLDKGFIRIRRERLENGFSKNYYELVQMIPETVPRQNVGIRNVGVGNVGIQSVGVGNEGTNSNSLKSININNNNTKNNQPNNQPDKDFAKVIEFYEKNISIVRPMTGEKLGGLVDDFTADLVLYALEITASNPKVTNPIKYATSILTKWKENLVSTRQQAEIYESNKRGDQNANNSRGTQENGGTSNPYDVARGYCSE